MTTGTVVLFWDGFSFVFPRPSRPQNLEFRPTILRISQSFTEKGGWVSPLKYILSLENICESIENRNPIQKWGKWREVGMIKSIPGILFCDPFGFHKEISIDLGQKAEESVSTRTLLSIFEITNLLKVPE